MCVVKRSLGLHIETTKPIAECLIPCASATVGRSATTAQPASRPRGLAECGLLLFGTAAFVFVQRLGLFTGALEFLRKIGLKIGYLEAREEKLRSLDRMILEFYLHNRPAVYSSTGLFFLSWMAEALEVYVIIWYLGGPARALSAISIAALSVFIKSSTFFILAVLAPRYRELFLLQDFGTLRSPVSPLLC